MEGARSAETGLQAAHLPASPAEDLPPQNAKSPPGGGLSGAILLLKYRGTKQERTCQALFWAIALVSPLVVMRFGRRMRLSLTRPSQIRLMVVVFAYIAAPA